MARIGIVGLPNVGKTTLFNALTGLEAVTAPHPFATTEPNVGVAWVVDPLLDEAAKIEGSKKTVYAGLDLLDLPAMATGGQGGGPAGQFLGRLREVEALAVVVRAFVDEAVPAEEAGSDPAEQAEAIGLELVVADSDVFRRSADRVAKEATADPTRKRAAEALARAVAVLDEGEPLRSVDWTEEDRVAFRDLAPLTLKPVVWVINVAEEEEDAAALSGAVAAAVPDGDVVVALSARLEEEAGRLEPEERAELYDGLGMGEGALARIVQASYQALGLLSFYTVGPKESHAWTVRRGASARTAAGKIHSDLERGFIRAEVIPMSDVLAGGGWDAAKAAGSMRLEGKDYVVQDEDVLVIRFSV